MNFILAQLLSSFDGSFWQILSFENSISLIPLFLTKKRIRGIVPSVLRQGFQGKGNRTFEWTVPSKTSVKAIITTGLMAGDCKKKT